MLYVVVSQNNLGEIIGIFGPFQDEDTATEWIVQRMENQAAQHPILWNSFLLTCPNGLIG